MISDLGHLLYESCNDNADHESASLGSANTEEIVSATESCHEGPGQ